MTVTPTIDALTLLAMSKLGNATQIRIGFICVLPSKVAKESKVTFIVACVFAKTKTACMPTIKR